MRRVLRVLRAMFTVASMLALGACSAPAPDEGAGTRAQAASTRPARAGDASAKSDVVAADLPAAVRAACDLVADVAGRAPGVGIERSSGPFEDELERRSRNGCTVSIKGSFAALKGKPDPFALLRDEFTARGWREDASLAADGPDGTRFALAHEDVVCFFEGRWDGGDDADPAYRPDDRFAGSARCAALH